MSSEMSRQLKVLIVEDSHWDAELLVAEIKREGYQVFFDRVETAEAFESALGKGDWDVILSDYMMPQFSALEALALYKASGRDIPFILVSGTVGEETAVVAMKAGAHDFLLKGKLARLVPILERELRIAQYRREKHDSSAALRMGEELVLMSEPQFKTLEVKFGDGGTGVGRSAWINAAWICKCNDPAPLIGRCVAAGPSEVICPTCGRKFQILPGEDHSPSLIREA
jgi:CheY-like chemotaxis protein